MFANLLWLYYNHWIRKASSLQYFPILFPNMASHNYSCFVDHFSPEVTQCILGNPRACHLTLPLTKNLINRFHCTEIDFSGGQPLFSAKKNPQKTKNRNRLKWTLRLKFMFCWVYLTCVREIHMGIIFAFYLSLSSF